MGRKLCRIFRGGAKKVLVDLLKMKITQKELNELTEKAKATPRLRMNLDLRNSEEDQSQRMLNAIEPGSPIPIHRHRTTSETMTCLRGQLIVMYYDEAGKMIEEIELSPNGDVVVVNIPIGQWYTVRALESGTVILTMQNGPYMPVVPEDLME